MRHHNKQTKKTKEKKEHTYILLHKHTWAPTNWSVLQFVCVSIYISFKIVVPQWSALRCICVKVYSCSCIFLITFIYKKKKKNIFMFLFGIFLFSFCFFHGDVSWGTAMKNSMTKTYVYIPLQKHTGAPNNEAWHFPSCTLMSHVTYKGVMAHIKESWHL